MTTVAILQPGYLPWLGFFDQLRRCDVFVYYDDVQFDKHGWRNRNRIKSPAGSLWLTVPVLTGGRQGQAIMDAEIDDRVPWQRKHLASIAQNYARAPYLSDYLDELEEVLKRPWKRLVDLDIAVAALMSGWLGIRRTIARSSELDIGGDQSERLLNICRHFGARRYLSGDSARNYLDLALFRHSGISVEWQNYGHPRYPQLHGDFLPYMSALDLVLNMGPKSLSVLEGKM
jgi:hypothetical protein